MQRVPKRWQHSLPTTFVPFLTRSTLRCCETAFSSAGDITFFLQFFLLGSSFFCCFHPLFFLLGNIYFFFYRGIFRSSAGNFSSLLFLLATSTVFLVGASLCFCCHIFFSCWNIAFSSPRNIHFFQQHHFFPLGISTFFLLSFSTKRAALS